MGTLSPLHRFLAKLKRPEVETVRASVRRYVRLDCQVVRERDFKLVGEVALDLSLEGMLVRSNHRVLTGEPVIVSFRPPRSNRFVDAIGTVTRVVHGRRPEDSGSRSLGIRFHQMDQGHRSHLFEQLRGLAQPEPQRPLRSLV